MLSEIERLRFEVERLRRDQESRRQDNVVWFIYVMGHVAMMLVVLAAL